MLSQVYPSAFSNLAPAAALLVIHKTPGPEILRPDAFSGDNGLTLVERAPYGVIAAITPSTNPTETIINNGIGMVSGGNAVAFNVHPGAKRCSAWCIAPQASTRTRR